MKRSLSLIVLFAAALSVCAQAVDVEAARSCAKALLAERSLLKSVDEPRLMAQSDAAFVFANAAGRYVVMAADERLPEVLAYGVGGAGEMPPAMRALLSLYDLRLASTTTPIAAAAQNVSAVGPLLTSTHDQDAPYNALCPYYAYNDSTVSTERCLVGCVATALEQILAYYDRTYTLADTIFGYSNDHYAVDTILPGQSVDASLILDNYDGDYTDAQLDAVARLGLWLGTAVRMSYGVSASGASSYRAVEPLKRAFGLPYVEYMDSYDYQPADWLDMLYAELAAGRPVYYAAYTELLSGHAFVLDGNDADGNFHVNWGYGGQYDGYFDLAVLYAAEPLYDTTEAGSQMGFYCCHEALFLCPDSVEAQFPDTVARRPFDVEVIDCEFDAYPTNALYTPLTLTVRNNADTALITDFLFFSNTPADTSVWEQGEALGFAHANLEPGEVAQVPATLRFSSSGDLILRVTIDGDTFQTLKDIYVVPYTAAPEMSFSPFTLEFSDNNTTVSLVETIENQSESVRMGHITGYYLEPLDETEREVAHSKYIYLEAGNTQADTISFRQLIPGHTYRAYLRCPWTIRVDTTFTMPTSSGIEEIEQIVPENSQFYDLFGRKISKPEGIAIKGRKKFLISR